MKVAVKQYGLRAKALARVVVFSDVHFRFRKHDYRKYGCLAQHEAMVRFTRAMKPDAIILAGDNFESVDVMIGPGKLQKYLESLRELSSIAPVFYGLGNHERKCRLNLPESRAWDEYRKILDKVEQVEGLTLLNDSWATVVPGINIVGLTLPTAYYSRDVSDEAKHSLLRGKILSSREMLSGDETIITLIHSPEHIGERELELMPDVDYVLAGHMHDGCIPTKLQRFSRNGRGIIGPNKALFPKRSMDRFTSYEDKVITLGAVGCFSQGLEPLNLICLPKFTLIDFSEVAHEDTPSILQMRIQNV